MSESIARVWGSAILSVILVALFPVVVLWETNVRESISTADILLTATVVTGCSLAVLLVMRIVLSDLTRAALVTLVVQALVLSFGHVADSAHVIPGSTRELLLFAGWFALGAALSILAVRLGRDRAGIFGGINAILVVLLAWNLFGIARSELSEAQPSLTAAQSIDLDGAASVEGRSRDVYYLIFDRYAGATTLRDLYGFDNSPFLDELRARGFVLPTDARANYPQTTHSLASSLNMTYLDRLADAAGSDSSSWMPLYASLRGFTAARAFQELGYRYVHVGSWWPPTSRDWTADENVVFGEARGFSEVFLSTTILPRLAGQLGILPSTNLYRRHYDHILAQLDALKQVADDPRPTFTFAHVLLPHTPYVFDADGSYRGPSDARTVERNYLDQLTYANTAILELVDEIQRRTRGPAPIVVLQSDEGPHPPEQDSLANLRVSWPEQTGSELGRKLHILNAYRLPGQGEPVPADVTPVNTFRLILDRYFDAGLPLLSDRVFVFEDHSYPYRFTEVTDRL